MKTIKETRVDKTLLRLVDTGKLFVGIAIVGDTTKLSVEGATAEEVWSRLHDEVGKTNPKYVGYAGARNRFLHFFPNGFHSNGCEANERDYKVAARERLIRSVPLADAAEGVDFGEAVLSVFRATNLLSPFEKNPASGRSPRPLRRPVHPGGGTVHAGPDQSSLARHGTSAEAPWRGEMDGGHLPAVPVAPRGAHVSEARGHQGFRGSGRTPVRIRLRAAS
jgi:hypothetical protein